MEKRQARDDNYIIYRKVELELTKRNTKKGICDPSISRLTLFFFFLFERNP